MKKIFLLLCMLTGIMASAQESYRTRILSPNIKTLQVSIPGEKLFLPVIEKDGTDKIEIEFDEMSHESHNYVYTVLHCNADWTPSDLSSGEYLNGFTTNYIDDFERSLNTHFLYTHYKFNVPNDDMNFSISGNYVVIIYEEGQRDQPIAHACFSIVEPRINISAQVRGNTDIELNRRFQQVDMDIDLKNYPVRDPMNEIKTVVRQNNRIDNQVTGAKPAFLSGDKLSYTNNKELIFEGGNEFHNIDISSAYTVGRGVDHLFFNNNYFEANLLPDKIQSGAYLFDEDVNGKFLINYQEAFNNVDTEADYILVNFSLPVRQPFFDGQLFIGGEFNYNIMNADSRMTYDNRLEMYRLSVLLKQGGYNYQYRFLPKGSSQASVARVEGSYWQTQNEYTIYVYHRAWGERYDKLIGVKSVISNQ